jgi:hypothetical protein
MRKATITIRKTITITTTITTTIKITITTTITTTIITTIVLYIKQKNERSDCSVNVNRIVVKIIFCCVLEI